MKKLNSFKEILVDEEIKNSFINDLISCLSNIGLPVLEKDEIIVEKLEENTVYIGIPVGTK